MNVKSMASLTFAWLLLGLAGCATSGWLKVPKNDFAKAGPKNPVVRILGVWEPAMGIGLDDKSARGFSGQIYFFSQGSDLAVKVDGDVRVYVFDDEGTPDDQMQPLHEANFSAEAWNQLLTRGPLGATYNVFIPYIRPGNFEAKCTLRIRYKPANGPIAYSDFVNICLEGKKKPGAQHEYDETAAHLNAHPKSSGGLANQMAAAAEARAATTPPRTRGLEEAITTSLDDSLQLKRPSAVPLTDQERERIVREVRARMKAETDGTVALAGYEDSDGDAGPTRPARSRKQSHNPLHEDEFVEGSDDGSLRFDPGEEPDDGIRPERRQPNSGRRHILAETSWADDDGESALEDDLDTGLEAESLLDEAQ
jgi:hypothetical protein